jgi:endonuclease G, mitochondrial
VTWCSLQKFREFEQIFGDEFVMKLSLYLPGKIQGKKHHWVRSWVGRLLTGFSVCLMLVGCNLLLPAPRVDNVNLLLGNPSNATANPANANNYLIDRPQYVLSYNRDKGIANWVSWQLNQSWLGDLPRISFAPDPSLPTDWYQVKPDDYTNSGFDRGHLVPAADRDRTPEDREAAFLMTNIMPQAPDNNRGVWERLESYCRELVSQGKELYIIAGGIGAGGSGERGSQTTIAQGKVTVPANTWKIVVVIDRLNAKLSDITEATRVIAVVIPNRQGVQNRDWSEFSTSVDDVEALTGYEFLSNVPRSIQTVIEAKVDN